VKPFRVREERIALNAHILLRIFDASRGFIGEKLITA